MIPQNPNVARRQRTRTESLEDLVGVRIIRLAEVFLRLAKINVGDAWGVRSTDMRILNLLDGTDGVSVSEIARRAHLNKGWISRSICQIERDGLVERRADSKDSRITLIALTPRARELLDDLRPYVRRSEQHVLKGIDAVAFKRDLDRLLTNVESMLDDTSNALKLLAMTVRRRAR